MPISHGHLRWKRLHDARAEDWSINCRHDRPRHKGRQIILAATEYRRARPSASLILARRRTPAARRLPMGEALDISKHRRSQYSACASLLARHTPSRTT